MKKALSILAILAAVAAGVIGFETYQADKPRRDAAVGFPSNQIFTTARSTPANITITSDPEGASVTFANKTVGATPIIVQVDAGTQYHYNLTAQEPYADYNLYKPFSGSITATEDTTISVWIDRTTAEDQAAQRAAVEEARRAREEVARRAEQERKEAAERAEQERQRRLEAERLYYRIETNCRYGADVTYSNAYGDTTQQSNQGTGWYYYFVPKSGQFLYLSAQNQCDSGFVRVKLVKDGVTIRENTSTGAYVIATVSGRW